MLFEQNAVLTSLRRAQQFMDDNATVLGAVNQSARKELDDVVARLSDLAVVQDSGTRGSRGETSRQRALRLALRRDHMTPIAEVAKYKLRDVPEFSALMLPAANATAESQIASAKAMADAASLHAQTFIDAGLSAAFADEMRAAATAVKDSLMGRGKHHGDRTGATSGLTTVEKQARALLRVLNAVIVPRIAKDSQLSRAWQAAKAVQKKPGPAAGSHDSGTKPVPSANGVTPAPTPMLVPSGSPALTAPAPAAPPLVAVAA